MTKVRSLSSRTLKVHRALTILTCYSKFATPSCFLLYPSNFMMLYLPFLTSRKATSFPESRHPSAETALHSHRLINLTRWFGIDSFAGVSQFTFSSWSWVHPICPMFNLLFSLPFLFSYPDFTLDYVPSSYFHSPGSNDLNRRLWELPINCFIRFPNYPTSYESFELSPYKPKLAK